MPGFEPRPEVRAAYDRFARSHYGEIDELLLAETMWNAGGRAATQALVSFSDLLPIARRLDDRLHLILGLLEGMVEGPAPRRVGRVSPVGANGPTGPVGVAQGGLWADLQSDTEAIDGDQVL